MSDALSDTADKIAAVNSRLDRRGAMAMAMAGGGGGNGGEDHHDVGQGSSFAFSCGSNLFPDFLPGSAEEGSAASSSSSSSLLLSPVEGAGQVDDPSTAAAAPWLELARSHCNCAVRQLTKKSIFEFDAAKV